MTLPLTGGCQCGALRYEITEAPRLTYACHCTDCQRMTSSAFSMAIVVSEIAFRLTKGEPRSIQRTADSGHVTTRWVCPDCGSWICGAPRASSATPGAVRAVRAGTLDDTSWLRPMAHFWTRSKQPWVALPESSRSFETQPADLVGFFASGGEPTFAEAMVKGEVAPKAGVRLSRHLGSGNRRLCVGCPPVRGEVPTAGLPETIRTN